MKFDQKSHQWGQFGKNRSFFGKNGPNWVILGAKMSSYVNILRMWSNNLFHKIDSKNNFTRVYGQKFGQKVINGVNLAKIGHFGENGQIWVILWAKMRSYVKNWGNLSNIFFPKSF